MRSATWRRMFARSVGEVFPHAGAAAWAASRGEFDVLGSAGGHLGEGLAGHGRGIVEVVSVRRRHPLPADVVLVAGLEGDERAVFARPCVYRHGNSFAAMSSGVIPD